jgi:hypothetical protein
MESPAWSKPASPSKFPDSSLLLTSSRLTVYPRISLTPKT